MQYLLSYLGTRWTQNPSWIERLTEAVRQRLGPPLKAWHEPFDAWLGSLPMSVAMICAIGLYVLAAIWVWTLRKEYILIGAPDRRWWRDLRIWATLLLIPYVSIYLLLGR